MRDDGTLISQKKGDKAAGDKEIGKMTKKAYFSLETTPPQSDNGGS